MFLNVKVTMHWITIPLVILAYLVCIFIGAMVILVKYKKCVRAFESGDFDYVLRHEKLLFHFRKSPIPTASLHYMLAVSYFNRNDDNAFVKHMDLVSIEELQWGKDYWLAIYAVAHSDFAQCDSLQEKLLIDSMDSQKTMAYEVLTLAYKHQKEGDILSYEEREKIASNKHDRIKQMFS